MTDTDSPDMLASEIHWDLDTLLDDADPEALLDRARALVVGIAGARGTLAQLDAVGLSALLRRYEDVQDLLVRVGSHANLAYTIETDNPERSRWMVAVDEALTEVSKDLLFIELEWAALDDDRALALAADPELAWCRHWLVSARRYRPHLRSEPEERVLADKGLTGAQAFSRLFDELMTEARVTLPDHEEPVPLELALSLFKHPEREMRDTAARALSDALQPSLRTRTFIYNTLMQDKAADDRLRGYPTWLSSRNLANEASDSSVQALLDAVSGRFGLARRWYRIKGRLLGLETLYEHDRYAPLAKNETRVGWAEAQRLVLDAYDSFSPELATIGRRFFDERWIHAPVQEGKLGGAFCAYTSPRHHPYLVLNWTGRPGDVLTLAHELGHGLHGYLSREQGLMMHTPLTLAETASVFGETVTFAALLETVGSDDERLALLSEAIEGNMATVFRQVAMLQFEDRAHRARREEGELSVEQLGAMWMETQQALYGDVVVLQPRYATWWSYIPHFVRTPGYVYAYAYGQLFALSVYQRYRELGQAFVPAYLELLKAGGSRPPAELTRLVGCDLEDPGFWDAGLDLVRAQVDEAEALAAKLSRL